MYVQYNTKYNIFPIFMSNEKSKLIIGISSRALFNLDESHEIYEKQGLKSYQDYQIENEDNTLAPGEAFNLVEKILKINDLYDSSDRVEVILLSRNTSDTGLRIRNSIEDHNLNISRAAFCGGESPHRYVKDFGVHLFLSSSIEDVKLAIESNVAAATIIPRSNAETNLKEGPFKSFLVELNKIQNDFEINECPIRTALVTARSAPSDKRVIKTLRDWGVRIDESLFLGGMSKSKFLDSFDADIFFDDQKKHIMSAIDNTTSGHVPYGIKNE